MDNIKMNGFSKLILAVSCFVLACSIFVFSLSSLSKVYGDANSRNSFQTNNPPTGEFGFQIFIHAGYMNALVWKTSTGRSQLYFFEAKTKTWKPLLVSEQLPQIPLR